MAGLGSLMEPVVLFGAHGAGDRCLVCVCGGGSDASGGLGPLLCVSNHKPSVCSYPFQSVSLARAA